MAEPWWKREIPRGVKRGLAGVVVVGALGGLGLFWHVITAPPEMQFRAHIVGPGGEYYASAAMQAFEVHNGTNYDVSCHLGDDEIGTDDNSVYLQSGDWAGTMSGTLSGGRRVAAENEVVPIDCTVRAVD